MTRVYVEIDGVIVSCEKIGRSILGRRFVRLRIMTPDAKSAVVALEEGESATVKLSHTFESGPK